MAMAAVCRIRLARSLASSALHALFSIRSISSRSQLPTFTRNEVLYVQRCRENSWKQPGQGRYFSSTESVAHIVLSMPALSPTMNQGNIVKWRKKQGEKIEVGDVLCEIETDKATLEYESLEEGYLAKILVPEGSKDVIVGQPIAVTVEEEGDIEKVPDVAGTAETQPMQDISTVTIKHEADQKSSFNRIGPAAKLLIHSHGLDASSLKASGPRSTLLKGDVLAAIKSGLGSSTAAASQHQKSSGRQSSDPQLPSALKSPIDTDPQLAPVSEDLPNSQIRKIIARRLLESKMTTPHTYLSSDAILDHLVAFRQKLKEKNGVKVSVNDLIVKAVAVTLRAVPEANAYWDLEKEEVALCDSVDISIAVATEKGLMTPIIRNADQKSLTAISTEIKELAEKARAGKLAPHEFQGGTFSISNLGMFPVDHFCAIINPPQACILAVGQTTKVVEPVTNADGTETIVAVSKMKFTVSADHRVIDGRIGGAFLTTLSSNLSDVKRLIL